MIGNLGVAISDNEVLRSMKVEVSTKVLPWAFLGWGCMKWLPWFLWAMTLACGICFNCVCDILFDSRPVNTLLGMVLACTYAWMAFMNFLEYFLPFCGWNDECFTMKHASTPNYWDICVGEVWAKEMSNRIYILW